MDDGWDGMGWDGWRAYDSRHRHKRASTGTQRFSDVIADFLVFEGREGTRGERERECVCLSMDEH